MQISKAFTLIELLVVISIISIISTLVISQLGNARGAARDAKAKSDVTEAGKAIEAFKNDESSGGGVISEKLVSGSFGVGGYGTGYTTGSGGTVSGYGVPLIGITLSGTTSWPGSVSPRSFPLVFSGTQVAGTTALSYAVKISRTPADSYTYDYCTTTTTTQYDTLTSGSDNGYVFGAYGMRDGSLFSIVNGSLATFSIVNGSTIPSPNVTCY